MFIYIHTYSQEQIDELTTMLEAEREKSGVVPSWCVWHHNTLIIDSAAIIMLYSIKCAVLTECSLFLQM